MEELVIDTDDFRVEISKDEYKKALKFCTKNKISLNYYFHEFMFLEYKEEND